MTVIHKPTVTNTIESPLSLELELESQHTIDDLEPQGSELHYEGDKVRMGSDSAIGDVYSNGQFSNSSVITSKETDTSNSSSDLKCGETIPDKHQISVHITELDDDNDDDYRNEYDCANAFPPIERADNLSSSPSWNLDGQTPEPEFGSFSVPEELNPIEHSAQATTQNYEETSEFVDYCHQSDDRTSLRNGNERDDSFGASREDEMDDDVVRFNADFGQFATFDDEHFNAVVPEAATIVAVTSTNEPSNQCDKIQAAFDDNNDENNGEGNVGDANEIVDYDDDDDDEFGEFNDFQQMPAVQNTTASTNPADTAMQRDVAPNANVLLDSENIKLNLSSILDTIFPAAGTATATDSDFTYEKQQFITNLTRQLRNVENSNALNHQWAKSTSKTMLVKALGIDSRNIVSKTFESVVKSMNFRIEFSIFLLGWFFIYQLYGEKWNSSAPKFAANLGLSPLEPMKVTSLSTTTAAPAVTTKTTTSSSSSSSLSSLSAFDSDIKGHKPILEVPAAQFDWNSSGLINPLDGKQTKKQHENTNCYNNQNNSMILSENYSNWELIFT